MEAASELASRGAWHNRHRTNEHGTVTPGGIRGRFRRPDIVAGLANKKRRISVMIIRSVFFLCLLSLPGVSSAHHAVAGNYDSQTVIEVEGEIISLLMRNPHPTITCASFGTPANDNKISSEEASGGIFTAFVI